jgi:hypothetical protein
MTGETHPRAPGMSEAAGGLPGRAIQAMLLLAYEAAEQTTGAGLDVRGERPRI